MKKITSFIVSTAPVALKAGRRRQCRTTGTGNRLLKTVFLLAFVCISAVSWGQKAKIEKVWVDAFTFEAGVRGVKVHAKFSVEGMQYKQGSCSVWFFDATGMPLKDLNGLYRTSNGQVSVYGNFTAPHANSLFTDLSLFIPADEFHINTNGAHVIKYQVAIFDNFNRQIATSQYAYFTLNIL
jgi:hypothetical protein